LAYRTDQAWDARMDGDRKGDDLVMIGCSRALQVAVNELTDADRTLNRAMQTKLSCKVTN
jgi:hypothetical protein